MSTTNMAARKKDKEEKLEGGFQLRHNVEHIWHVMINAADEMKE